MIYKTEKSFKVLDKILMYKYYMDFVYLGIKDEKKIFFVERS